MHVNHMKVHVVKVYGCGPVPPSESGGEWIIMSQSGVINVLGAHRFKMRHSLPSLFGKVLEKETSGGVVERYH